MGLSLRKAILVDVPALQGIVEAPRAYSGKAEYVPELIDSVLRRIFTVDTQLKQPLILNVIFRDGCPHSSNSTSA